MTEEAASFILSSAVRVSILRHLSRKSSNPTSIAREERLHLSHVCRALSELKMKELVYAQSHPKEREKYYSLTAAGYDLVLRIAILGR